MTIQVNARNVPITKTAIKLSSDVGATKKDNTGRGARTGDDPVYLWQSILEEIYPRSQNQSGFMYDFPK